MDHYLESSPTVGETTRKEQYLVTLIAKGGFTLIKLVSNVGGVLLTLSRMKKPNNGNLKAIAAADESAHVLGLKWIDQFDTLVVSRRTSTDCSRSLIQRIVLSLVSAVYDPFGLVTPYTVKSRLLLKDTWRLSGQKWVDNLRDIIADKFFEWSDELTRLTEITVPRSFFDGQLERVELKIFGDSS